MLVLGTVVAYLIGSIPFALLLARRWGGRDLHRFGSGNIGAANVLRASGVRVGIATAVLDVAKGVAGVLVAERMSNSGHASAIAGFAAVVGHIYPVWLRFKGGKGVATACGVFSVLAPVAVPVAAVAFVAATWATRYISIGSVAASLVLPMVAYATGSPAAIAVSASVTAMLVVFRHRSNLQRVRVGTERRLGAQA